MAAYVLKFAHDEISLHPDSAQEFCSIFNITVCKFEIDIVHP